MRRRLLMCSALLGLGLLSGVYVWARQDVQSVPTHRFFHVQWGSDQTRPVSGRLLLFAMTAAAAKAQSKDGPVTEIDADPFEPNGTSIAAENVDRLVPGQTIDIDTDQLAFPAAWSKLPAGDYLVQAVLDVHHNYNYLGRDGGDIVSKVVTVHLPANDIPTLTLDETLPHVDPWAPPASMPTSLLPALEAAHKQSQQIDFVSPSLSAFWGRPIHMLGRVLLPPGYEPSQAKRYPTVYFTHGFGGNIDRLARVLAYVQDGMSRGQMPPMIWVFLDESSATGTHEFADSVNNGPWGQALTTELIPYLESHYRMDGNAKGRFLNGHSSGGWATLWLQTRYPAIFGGTWSTSPDPSDFHDFTGPDLYAPHANVYRKPDGTPWPLVRDKGKVIGTFEQFARMERVLGPYGGQMASFEWVFSPRGKDGRPEQMFDRDTGEVDPAVVAYWHDHYDIAYRLQQHWPALKPDLDGKIHLYVGTADTFYLDGAAHRLEGVLDGLHAHADFRFIPGRTHFDLYKIGDDNYGLLKQISWDMYAVARPDSKLKPGMNPSP
ncbi:MAG TPA: alpha/beta hydrolase-fold protein [Dyella sp.]|uniref:alpha/beta hydrolase n=1 Tax=Dyella sp. TaxID=1869338 RepID=UPI002C6B6FA9|nr:alpha/beta hydrolase-fold protein [Dyella sp.]HTV84265.1 alpha/beta hydrolase-fold protein [Dyella sp.]